LGEGALAPRPPGAATAVSSNSPALNWKGQLLEWAQKRCPGGPPARGAVTGSVPGAGAPPRRPLLLNAVGKVFAVL